MKHAPRARFWLVLIFLLVGLFVLQRFCATGDRAEIERTVEAVTVGKKPSHCETRTTPRYLMQITGARPPFADDICEREFAESRTRSVQTSEIEIDGDEATAVMTLRGGSLDGSRLVVKLVDAGGNWRMDRLVSFRHFDRPGFDRSYRREFLEFGSPTRSADCAIRRSRRLSNAEIEHAILYEARRVFAPIPVACDRDGVERSLVGSIADPQFDLPQRVVRCAADEMKTLSDAELVRVERSFIAYGEVLYRCDRNAIFAYMGRELEATQDLDPAATRCVLQVFRSRSVPAAIRLSYDEDAYDSLIDRCRDVRVPSFRGQRRPARRLGEGTLVEMTDS